MLYFRASVICERKKWEEIEKDSHLKNEQTRNIISKCESFNQLNTEFGFFFISHIANGEISCGIITQDPDNVMKKAEDFFGMLGEKTKDLQIEEITFSVFNSLLSRGERYDYINDADDVLERFGLGQLNDHFLRRFDFGENLLNPHTDKKLLYHNAEKMLTMETMVPELDRIYSGKSKSKAFGHPVHYFIETNDRDIRKRIYRNVLQALYANNRLKSRRYCFVDIKPGQRFSEIAYDVLYKTCIDGAIVVRYLAGESFEDDDFANGEMETISTICKAMLKYRNSVLTVFCLPKVCENVKKIFMENLGGISMIEIKEDLADKEKAKEYLKMLCKQNSIASDKKLFEKLSDEEKYYPDDLREIFSEWFNLKMKTVIYPQYRNIVTCRKLSSEKKSNGNAFDELSEMIGLEKAKSVIGQALDYYKFQRIFKEKGIKQDRPAMHMIFTGNPGTAKTTVARLFARIMKENGLLPKGHLVEVGRSDLVGKYVGWTAQIVKEKFKSASGGVLFIDEAYSLVEDRGGMYGDEAINTIVQEMENRREDLVVIFAGYPDKMEQFLNKNPGLRSRIAFHVPFENYTANELCRIAEHIGKNKGIMFSDGALTKLSTIFETARQQTDFGNGRYVRNIIEISRMNQASRILAMDPDTITKKSLQTLEASDIEIPATGSQPVARRIGFGA